jgi:hypothetical protein
VEWVILVPRRGTKLSLLSGPWAIEDVEDKVKYAERLNLVQRLGKIIVHPRGETTLAVAGHHVRCHADSRGVAVSYFYYLVRSPFSLKSQLLYWLLQPVRLAAMHSCVEIYLQDPLIEGLRLFSV